MDGWMDRWTIGLNMEICDLFDFNMMNNYHFYIIHLSMLRMGDRRNQCCRYFEGQFQYLNTIDNDDNKRYDYDVKDFDTQLYQ